MADHFHKLIVDEVRRETADAVSIRFSVPVPLKAAFAFRAGQHLTVRREFGGEDLRRNYSVCVAPGDGELRIAVKEIAGGVFSSFLNHALRPGDILEVMPPHGSFTWEFDAHARRTYVAFAGGSGITPVLSLLKTALGTELKSHFHLVYGNRLSQSTIFFETLAGLKDRYLDRFQLTHVFEDEADEIALFNGRLDREKCDELLNQFGGARRAAAYFICGPGPMMDATERALLARAVPRELILIERFTATPLSREAEEAARDLSAKAAGRKMSVTLSGRRFSVVFDAQHGNILDSVRAAGQPAPFACKGGVCATCRAKVTAGRVEMKQNYALSPREVAEGFVLTCQSTPLTDDVALTYD